MLKLLIYFLLVAILSVCGCTVGPNFCSPTLPCISKYTSSPALANTAAAPIHGGTKQHIHYCKDIPAAWWRLFRSPCLNYLIETGLNNNPSLAEAQATLLQMQADLRSEVGATFYPQFDSKFTAQRMKNSLIATGINLIPVSGVAQPFRFGNVFNLYNASVCVDYDLDIWGGGRRHIEALLAQVEHDQFELQATYLSLSANTVTTAISIASLRKQIEVTERIIINKKQQIVIMKQNLKLGHSAPMDILTQETTLKETEATLPTLRNNLAQKMHALSVLIGCLPSESVLPSFNLSDFHLPRDLPVSLPSLLIRQRPDIRSAEALLHKASAEVGVATANLLPDFKLTGSYGYSANVLGTLIGPANAVWNYGTKLTLPLFHGGELWEKRNSSMQAYCFAAAHYRRVVLNSFQNIADVMRALEYDAILLQDRVKFETLTKSQLNIRKTQYHLGHINYLSFLLAEEQYNEAQLKTIDAQAARFADTAALFQALGGGWWNCI